MKSLHVISLSYSDMSAVVEVDRQGENFPALGSVATASERVLAERVNKHRKGRVTEGESTFLKACIRLLMVLALVSLTGCATVFDRIEGSINVGNNAPTPGVRNGTEGCSPTFSDEPSPTYRANAPIRSVVGRGHVLTGVVLSSRDCQPIPNATLEFWPEEAGRGHPDASRATLFTDSAGKFRFECNPPEHIHMRISAAGYRTIFNNAYHPNGAPNGEFTIVLIPGQ